MNYSFIVRDVTRLSTAISEHLNNILKHHVLLLDAPMGAGKTTFVSALAALMGSLITPSSPTFSICNEYSLISPVGPYEKIIHMDLYRLQSTEELLNSGMDDYLYDPACFVIVEWPELITPMVAGPYTLMQIEVGPDHLRKFHYRYLT
ncbi:MAG: tRNA (adenosine(37)-N6)-threonylcarbamoyltransferase complex ATPase subunit type 1 TsaE [Saprospiraceae bacterium]|nr:tRNA (adenosine(37)-N6)-threonylcarbamoyltransferase complex ATPase subunit type 1 TsaE [Saprospiraceae bacterium]